MRRSVSSAIRFLCVLLSLAWGLAVAVLCRAVSKLLYGFCCWKWVALNGDAPWAGSVRFL